MNIFTKLFKKKEKSDIPNYVYGTVNGTLDDKRDKSSYKWRLIATEIHETINKGKK